MLMFLRVGFIYGGRASQIADRLNRGVWSIVRFNKYYKGVNTETFTKE